MLEIKLNKIGYSQLDEVFNRILLSHLSLERAVFDSNQISKRNLLLNIFF